MTMPSIAAPRPATVNSAMIVGYIVAFTTVLAPFNALVGVPFAGELSGELYFIVQVAFFPVVVLLMGIEYRSSISQYLPAIVCLILLSIVFSFLANYSDILGSTFRGRSALEKMMSSIGVVLFGLYYANVVYVAASTDLRRFFLKPLAFSIFIVVFVGLAQLVALLIPSTNGIYTAAFGWVNSANRAAGEIASGRVHSVLFEPAAFGSYMVYVLPWLIYLMLTQRQTFRKFVFLCLLLAALLLCVFSGTLGRGGGIAIVLIYIMVYICVRWLRSPSLTMLGLLLIYLGPLLILLIYSNDVAELLIRSHNNSSLTRFGTVVTLLNEFWEHPVFGVGIGQYAFHLYNNIPVWAYTWEFKRWMNDPTASFFPTFSVFGRIAGELGAFGLLIWLGNLFLIGRAAIAQALIEASGRLRLLGITVVVSFFSIGVNGWGEASFRGFGLWSTLGVALAYIRKTGPRTRL